MWSWSRCTGVVWAHISPFGVWIVLLKIAKPDLGGSLLTLGVALALGLASALPLLRREQARAGAAVKGGHEELSVNWKKR